MRSVAAAAVLLVPLIAASCTEENTGPLAEKREPGSISLSASAIELDDGDTLQVFANVLDQHDNTFGDLPEGVDLVWSSQDGGVVTVNASGRLIAVAPGTTMIRAETSDGVLAASAPVTVRPVATGVEILAGNAQDGLPNTVLDDSITVRVVDRHDDGVPGVEVRFRVTSGGGSVSPSYATTDANGEVRVAWTLGPVIGGQQIQAFAPGAGGPVSIGATISQVLFGNVDVPATANVGGTLAGALRVDSNLFPRAIGAAHVMLSWDPTKLQLAPASLTSGDYVRARYRVNNATGRLHVLSSDPDMTRGARAVAGLVFNVVGGAGTTTTLSLDITSLVGTDFQDATAAGIDGDVVVTIN